MTSKKVRLSGELPPLAGVKVIVSEFLSPMTMRVSLDVAEILRELAEEDDERRCGE